MVNYSTLLKTWGDTGSEYPNGYSYLEGEQPVDAWDNFLISNVISDLDSLINTTNDRIETDKGGSGGEPASPETAHLYHDSDNEAVEFWDSTSAAWHRLLAADGDTMAGSLDMGGYALTGAGTITDDNGNTVFDFSAGHVPESIVEQGSGSGLDADTVDGTEAANLGSGASDSGTSVVSPATDFNFAQNLSVSDDGDGTVTVDAANQPDSHTAVSEDGTQMYGSVNDINFQGFLNLIDDGDGTVSLDPSHNHDSRYYTESEMNTKLGNKSDTGHLHDSRYYTQSEADSNFDNFGSFTVTEGNGSEVSTIGSGGNITIYGGTDISTEMDASDNLQVSMTGNYDNYGSWTWEEGDGESRQIYSGDRAIISGGGGINTELVDGSPATIEVRHNNTSAQGDITTGGATVIDDIYIDGNGHVTNLNTQNRSIDDWNNSGNASNNNVDADTVDGQHASEIGLGNHDNSDHTTDYLPSIDYNPEADTHSKTTSASDISDVSPDSDTVAHQDTHLPSASEAPARSVVLGGGEQYTIPSGETWVGYVNGSRNCGFSINGLEAIRSTQSDVFEAPVVLPAGTVVENAHSDGLAITGRDFSDFSGIGTPVVETIAPGNSFTLPSSVEWEVSFIQGANSSYSINNTAVIASGSGQDNTVTNRHLVTGGDTVDARGDGLIITGWSI